MKPEKALQEDSPLGNSLSLLKLLKDHWVSSQSHSIDSYYTLVREMPLEATKRRVFPKRQLRTGFTEQGRVLTWPHLYHKYSQSQDYYYSKDLNAILSGALNSASVRWQDLETVLDVEELLKRYYCIEDYDPKMSLLIEYYKFHSDIPRFFAMPVSKTLNKYHDAKRKLEYKRIMAMLASEAKVKNKKIAMNDCDNEIRLTDADDEDSDDEGGRSGQNDDRAILNMSSDSDTCKKPLPKYLTMPAIKRHSGERNKKIFGNILPKHLLESLNARRGDLYFGGSSTSRLGKSKSRGNVNHMVDPSKSRNKFKEDSSNYTLDEINKKLGEITRSYSSIFDDESKSRDLTEDHNQSSKISEGFSLSRIERTDRSSITFELHHTVGKTGEEKEADDDYYAGANNGCRMRDSMNKISKNFKVDLEGAGGNQQRSNLNLNTNSKKSAKELSLNINLNLKIFKDKNQKQKNSKNLRASGSDKRTFTRKQSKKRNPSWKRKGAQTDRSRPSKTTSTVKKVEAGRVMIGNCFKKKGSVSIYKSIKASNPERMESRGTVNKQGHQRRQIATSGAFIASKDAVSGSQKGSTSKKRLGKQIFQNLRLKKNSLGTRGSRLIAKGGFSSDFSKKNSSKNLYNTRKAPSKKKKGLQSTSSAYTSHIHQFRGSNLTQTVGTLNRGLSQESSRRKTAAQVISDLKKKESFRKKGGSSTSRTRSMKKGSVEKIRFAESHHRIRQESSFGYTNRSASRSKSKKTSLKKKGSKSKGKMKKRGPSRNKNLKSFEGTGSLTQRIIENPNEDSLSREAGSKTQRKNGGGEQNTSQAGEEETPLQILASRLGVKLKGLDRKAAKNKKKGALSIPSHSKFTKSASHVKSSRLKVSKDTHATSIQAVKEILRTKQKNLITGSRFTKILGENKKRKKNLSSQKDRTGGESTGRVAPSRIKRTRTITGSLGRPCNLVSSRKSVSTIYEQKTRSKMRLGASGATQNPKKGGHTGSKKSQGLHLYSLSENNRTPFMYSLHENASSKTHREAYKSRQSAMSSTRISNAFQKSFKNSLRGGNGLHRQSQRRERARDRKYVEFSKIVSNLID